MFSFTDSIYHGNDKSPLNQTCSTRWARILVVNGGTWGPDKRPYKRGNWGCNPYRWNYNPTYSWFLGPPLWVSPTRYGYTPSVLIQQYFQLLSPLQKYRGPPCINTVFICSKRLGDLLQQVKVQKTLGDHQQLFFCVCLRWCCVLSTMTNHHDKPPFGAYFRDPFQPPNKHIWGFSGWNHSVFLLRFLPKTSAEANRWNVLSALSFDEFEQWKKREGVFFVGCRLGYGMRYCPIWSLGFIDTISHETRVPWWSNQLGNVTKYRSLCILWGDFLKWNSLNV